MLKEDAVARAGGGTLDRALEVPETLEQATDPAWLTRALAPVSGGARVTSVELAELVKTMASKVRIAVRFENDPDRVHRYCLKAFLGFDTDPTTIREGQFYTRIAPHLTMRLPGCPAAIFDHRAQRGILVLQDLIAAGARFCSALEPFTADLAAQSLEQLARLHARSADLLPANDWIPSRIEEIARGHFLSVEQVQDLLDDPRGETLDAGTRDAARLFSAMAVLAERNRDAPQTMLHGDCHAGNLFMTADGPGFTDWQLIQHGNWAFDVAYHICAVLPVETAAAEERHLLHHYLDALAALGGNAPDRETAWETYRAAQAYGFYHWAITRRQPPPITRSFTERLGAGVMRHDTYRLLGV